MAFGIMGVSNRRNAMDQNTAVRIAAALEEIAHYLHIMSQIQEANNEKPLPKI
jgi:hypothetical protein